MKYYHRTVLSFLLVLLAVCRTSSFSWAARQSEHDKARDAWMTGYVKLEEAGKAETAGNAVVALELYRRAHAAFLEVRRKYASWNPSLLSYRITYCEERIKRLETSVTAASAELSKPDLVALTRRQRQSLEKLRAENSEFKQKLALTAGALARAQREAARNVTAVEETKSLVTENRQLQDRVKVQEERITKLTKSVEELRADAGIKEVADKLRQELARAQARSAEMEKASKTYRKAYRNVKKQLGDANLARQTLAEETAGFKARETEHAETAGKLTEQIASLNQKCRELSENNSALKNLLEEEKDRSRATGDAERRAVDEIGKLRSSRDRFLKTSDENRELLSQVEDLLRQRRDITARLDAVSRENTTLDANLAQLNSKHEKARERAASARVTLETQLREAMARAEVVARERSSLQTALAEHEKEREELQLTLTRKEKELDEAKSETAKYTKAHSGNETDQEELNAQTAASDTTEKRLTHEINVLEKEVAALRETDKASRSEATRRETALTDLKTRHEALRTRADAASRELTQAKKELEARLQEDEKHEQALNRSNAQLAEARQQHADLTKRLAAADEIIKVQEAALQAGREKAAELETVAESLAQKASEEQQAQARLPELQRRLAAEKRAARSAREQAQFRLEEANRLNAMLDTFQEKNRELAAQATLAAQYRAKATAVEREAAQSAEDHETKLAQLTTELAEAKKRGNERLSLLQTQEDHIVELEAAKTALEQTAAQLNRETARLTGELQHLRAKSEVVDGLTATLTDVDATLAATREQLNEIRTEKDQAFIRVRELESLVQRKDEEIGKYQTTLSTESGKEDGRDRALLDQLRDLTQQLEHEEERRRALETVLAERDMEQAPAAPAARETVSPAGERNRREQERTFIVRGFLRQGLTAEQDGNIEAACWNYTRVLKDDPDNKVALERLGLIAAKNGNDEDAEQYLRRAFRLDPENANILLPLGFTFVRRGKADLAISMLALAVALDPQDPVVHRCLGVACSSLGWLDAAEVQFRRAFELDQKDRETAFNLAVLLASRTPSRMEEARKWYSKARELGSAGDPGLDELFSYGN